MELSELIAIRLTKDDKDAGTKKANNLGVNMSTYMRVLLKKDLKQQQ
tara:strand:+ start:5348 stop:5488 length:141 start_codon:yes stop_codon:yes gene_type:complete